MVLRHEVAVLRRQDAISFEAVQGGTSGSARRIRPATGVEVERVGSGLPDGDHQVLVTGRVLPCLFELGAAPLKGLLTWSFA